NTNTERPENASRLFVPPAAVGVDMDSSLTGARHLRTADPLLLVRQLLIGDHFDAIHVSRPRDWWDYSRPMRPGRGGQWASRVILAVALAVTTAGAAAVATADPGPGPALPDVPAQ